MRDEIKRTFHLAGLRNEAAKTLNGDEWKQFQKIKRDFADLRRFEGRAYEIEYDTRLEVARKRLINQAGAKNKDFKHRWFGTDNFDKEAITRQARRVVRDDQHKLMAHLETKEAQAVDSLLEKSQHRKESREKPKRDFERATDRRQQTDGLPHDRRHARSRS